MGNLKKINFLRKVYWQVGKNPKSIVSHVNLGVSEKLHGPAQRSSDGLEKLVLGACLFGPGWGRLPLSGAFRRWPPQTRDSNPRRPMFMCPFGKTRAWAFGGF